ncbi:hypothetical protein [Pedobacter sp.]
MPKFRTHLIIEKREADKIRKLSFQKFKLEFVPEPTNCYWEDIDGKSSMISYGGRDPKTIREDEIPMSEMLIETDSLEICEDFISIVQGGILLAYPDISFTHHFPFIDEYIQERDRLYSDKAFFDYLKKIENVAFGCIIAERVIENNQLVYAIEKYKTSLGLASFNPNAINPRYGQYFDHYDIKREFHTKAAFAIIAAFSAIEELQLEVRSSAKHPRFLNTDTGEWNPVVLEDVKKRLKDNNIPHALTMDWVYRGKPTFIEKDIKPYFGFNSQWIKYGENVRDQTLTIPEAIHNASYLRNYIAAHKFQKLTQYISPYDVYNVQALVRLLILHKLNFWEVMLKRNK